MGLSYPSKCALRAWQFIPSWGKKTFIRSELIVHTEKKKKKNELCSVRHVSELLGIAPTYRATFHAQPPHPSPPASHLLSSSSLQYENSQGNHANTAVPGVISVFF